MELPHVVVSHDGLMLSPSDFKCANHGGSGDVGMLPLLHAVLVKYFSCCLKSGSSLFGCVPIFRPQIDDNSASIQVSLQLADSMCVPQWMDPRTSNVFSISGPALKPQEVATVLLPLVMDVGLTVDSWHMSRVIRCDKIDKDTFAFQTGAR